MKKAALLLLVLSLLLAVPGCAQEEGDVPDTTDCAQLAAAILASQSDLPEMYAVTAQDPEFDAGAPLYVGGELAGSVEDGVLCYPVGPLASEAAVFLFDSPDHAAAAVETMEDYLDSRAAAFFGYAPGQAALAEGGEAAAMGRFAVLFILEEPDAARRALKAALSGEAEGPGELFDLVSPLREAGAAGPEDEPPSEPDAYDHDAVLAAYRSGDTSALTPKNLAVCQRLSAVLAQIVSPGMSQVEKELAVNDWMVFNAQYDPAELTNGPVGTPDPDNANPYGFLVNGLGICLGYSNTFQLFMDALGIPCLTVHGSAHGGEEHAWNLVELEGDWYAVDVTWNDPVFEDFEPSYQVRLAYAHTYFNVTSDFLRKTDHQWTEDVPEAEGTKWSYR